MISYSWKHRIVPAVNKLDTKVYDKHYLRKQTDVEKKSLFCRKLLNKVVEKKEKRNNGIKKRKLKKR